MPAIILLEELNQTFGQNFDFAGSVVEIVDKNYESPTVDGVLLQLNNQA